MNEISFLTMPLASPLGKYGEGKYVDQGPSARPEMKAFD